MSYVRSGGARHRPFLIFNTEILWEDTEGTENELRINN